jgi:hypothetical protein
MPYGDSLGFFELLSFESDVEAERVVWYLFQIRYTPQSERTILHKQRGSSQFWCGELQQTRRTVPFFLIPGSISCQHLSILQNNNTRRLDEIQYPGASYLGLIKGGLTMRVVMTKLRLPDPWASQLREAASAQPDHRSLQLPPRPV